MPTNPVKHLRQSTLKKKVNSFRCPRPHTIFLIYVGVINITQVFFICKQKSWANCSYHQASCVWPSYRCALWRWVCESNFARLCCHFLQCGKSVFVPRFSGPYFPAFRLNAERYSVFLGIHSKWGKIRTRKTPNTDSSHAVLEIYFLLRCYRQYER